MVRSKIYPFDTHSNSELKEAFSDVVLAMCDVYTIFFVVK